MELTASGYPLEIEQPDIEPYRAGNVGIDYVTRIDSGRPGPNVWINAITHGNETCGAIALDHLFRHEVRPTRGVLTLSFANIAAYRNTSAQWPLGTRFLDEDLNRVWGRLDVTPTSYEQGRARELRPLADSADVLLDLHAMTHPTEPLVIVGLQDSPGVVARGQALARTVGYPRLLVSDRGHAAGLRLRDYGGFGRADAANTALVIECGGWWERRSADFAILIALRMLDRLSMIDRDRVEVPELPSTLPPFRQLEATDTVTVKSSGFRFVEPFRGDEVIAKAGTLIAVDDGERVTTPYDSCFLMFPTTEPRPGETAVRLGRVSAL